jgi:hypothetical protein
VRVPVVDSGFGSPTVGVARAPSAVMDLQRLRFSEHVPPAPAADARSLRALPATWDGPIAESAIDGLARRAEGVAKVLRAQGKMQSVKDLRRAAELLVRWDALHARAFELETYAQTYRALVALRAELGEKAGEGATEDASIAWTQAGALAGAAPPFAHGPAFRETAALRNRAFRNLEAALARHARAGVPWIPSTPW